MLLASCFARCACTSIPFALGVVCILPCSGAFQLSGILVFLGSFSEHIFSLGISQSWRLSLQWFPTPSLPSFHCLAHCGGCLLSSLSRGVSWLHCQDLPAMGAVSFQGLPGLPIVKAPEYLRHQTSTSQVILFF